MSLRPGQGYNFTVTGGNLIQSKAKGTPGFQLLLETAGGDSADFTIWLTDKNRVGAIESFKVLGFSQQDLASKSFIEHQLPQKVVGKEVHGFMVEEEYKDKKTVKVGSISAKREEGGGLANQAAGFFAVGLEDADIPF